MRNSLCGQRVDLLLQDKSTRGVVTLRVPLGVFVCLSFGYIPAQELHESLVTALSWLFKLAEGVLFSSCLSILLLHPYQDSTNGGALRGFYRYPGPGSIMPERP
jgi:hypothetical protein